MCSIFMINKNIPWHVEGLSPYWHHKDDLCWVFQELMVQVVRDCQSHDESSQQPLEIFKKTLLINNFICLNKLFGLHFD